MSKVTRKYDDRTLKVAVKILKDMKRQREYNRQREGYCVHGNYIGTWYGPDYMCGICESGEDTVQAMYRRALTTAHKNVRLHDRQLSAAIDLMTDDILTGDAQAEVLQRITEGLYDW